MESVKDDVKKVRDELVTTGRDVNNEIRNQAISVNQSIDGIKALILDFKAEMDQFKKD